MGGCDLVCVGPTYVEILWPRVRGLVESTFWRGRSEGDIDTVFADLMHQRALLWIVWDGRKILAALVTKLIRESQGLVCLITACAGIELRRWKHVISDIEAFAKAEGCFCVRMEGRRGWKRILPDYQEAWFIFEKILK